MKHARQSRGLVLIVDDHEDNREMYAEYFGAVLSVRILTARSGEDAIAIAEREAPGVIVLDLGMPGIGGWETARRLKGSPTTRAAQIIALTGHASAADERSAREAGCDHFMAKPCDPVRLAKLVRLCLGEPAVSPEAPRARSDR